MPVRLTRYQASAQSGEPDGTDVFFHRTWPPITLRNQGAWGNGRRRVRRAPGAGSGTAIARGDGAEAANGIRAGCRWLRGAIGAAAQRCTAATAEAREHNASSVRDGPGER